MARYSAKTYIKAAELAAAGLSNTEIAQQLKVKPGGVARVISTGAKKLKATEQVSVLLPPEDAYAVVVVTPERTTLLIECNSQDLEGALDNVKKALVEGVKIISVELLPEEAA